jgi:hypothetical protein
MDLEKTSESTQYAQMLYQAVLSLKPGEISAPRQVPRMAQALALAEVMAARGQFPTPTH